MLTKPEQLKHLRNTTLCLSLLRRMEGTT